MAHLADVPVLYRRFFFENAGGPSRQVVSREVVEKKWQLVTLDCTHRILLPKYHKSAKVGCGFCGGVLPRAPGVPPGAGEAPAPTHTPPRATGAAPPADAPPLLCNKRRESS